MIGPVITLTEAVIPLTERELLRNHRKVQQIRDFAHDQRIGMTVAKMGAPDLRQSPGERKLRDLRKT